MFKNKVEEAAYVGNIGMMELLKFHKIATPDQKKKLKSQISQKKTKEAWKHIQQVTGTKLHKSVNEEKKSPHPDILPVAGAGQWGTDTLVNNYKRNTPGQLKSFKEYNKTK